MNIRRYVQHISGHGEKWEVLSEGTQIWVVRSALLIENLMLPKSEFILCDPPEQWIDVTVECERMVSGTKSGVVEGEFIIHGENRLAKLICGGGYRLQKIQAEQILPVGRRYAERIHVHAFLIEKRISTKGSAQ